MSDKPTHTPGPWQWTISDQWGQRFIRIHAGGPTIAVVHGSDNPQLDIQTAAANAKLIAAAPELLAACESLLTMIVEMAYFPDAVDAFTDARKDFAVAAIAKCRETP